MLKFPPINHKPLRLPDELFYKKTIPLEKGGEYYSYTAFDKTGKTIGIIEAEIEQIRPFSSKSFFPGFQKFKSMYIAYIESHKHNFAYKMLDFIQTESKKAGCEGRFHLYANDCYTPAGKQPPHVVYRKYGMNSTDELEIMQIDRYIKGEIPLEDLETQELSMYYLPKELENKNINAAINNESKKIPFIQKLINLFK